MPKQYHGRFDGEKCVCLVEDTDEINDLSNRWFGRIEDNALVLDIVEVAYLLLSGRLVIETAGNKIISDLDSLLDDYYACFREFFWPKLIVYKDLRDRGRRVRIVGENRFIVRDKHGALRLVFILEEGRQISIDDLVNYVDVSMDNGLVPVFAIVSLQGDLTYYEVTRTEPTK